MKLSIYLHFLIKPKLFNWLNEIGVTSAGSASPFVSTIILRTSVLAKMYSILTSKSSLNRRSFTWRCSRCSRWAVPGSSWRARRSHRRLVAVRSPFSQLRISFEWLRTFGPPCCSARAWWRLFCRRPETRVKGIFGLSFTGLLITCLCLYFLIRY